jgi:predicted permease
MAILVLIGLAASRAKVLTSVSKDLLARIIFYVTLPSMLFTNFSKLTITPELLSSSLQALLLSLFILLFMLLVGCLTSKMAGLRSCPAAIFRLHSMLGNVIYLGIPLILSQFGQEGLLYGSIFILVSNILMWTVGVAVITPGRTFSLRGNIWKMFNINTVAIITGFTLFLLSIKLPPLILDSVGALGSTTTFCRYIGQCFIIDGRSIRETRLHICYRLTGCFCSIIIIDNVL